MSKFTTRFLTLLIAGVFLSLTSLADTIEDHKELEPLPEMGPMAISFDACTGSGNTVTVHFNKILNFLKMNPALRDKPQGYKWATKEENAEAAQKIFKKTYLRYIAYAPTEIVLTQGYLASILGATGEKIREITYYSNKEPTIEELDVTVGLKLIKETQMQLMLEKKFAYMSIVFNDHKGNHAFVTIDRNKDVEMGGCDPVPARNAKDEIWVNPEGQQPHKR